ncbi:unnamed protein product [Rotaria magnacalcarata]|uniref:Uncharacterized protein n=1 Tax=Rotaria magnacalcarata TaxID=392030 RepID=A0A819XZP1_9BILA|nr:unnamed protein product [Rotaria magnacalcarata]
MKLDFAEEQNIEDYDKQDQRENVKQQMNTYSDIIQKEFKSSTMQDDIINNKGENVLNDQKYRQELIKYVHTQIIDIEQITNEINIDSEKQEIFHNLNNQFYKCKNDFNQIQKHEYFEIQPIFRTHLELAIRTLDIDLQLIGQILNSKTLTDIIPNKSSIIIKTSLQSMAPIELQIGKNIT